MPQFCSARFRSFKKTKLYSRNIRMTTGKLESYWPRERLRIIFFKAASLKTQCVVSSRQLTMYFEKMEISVVGKTPVSLLTAGKIETSGTMPEFSTRFECSFTSSPLVSSVFFHQNSVFHFRPIRLADFHLSYFDHF
jgi:hypothetical protein